MLCKVLAAHSPVDPEADIWRLYRAHEQLWGGITPSPSPGMRASRESLSREVRRSQRNDRISVAAIVVVLSILWGWSLYYDYANHLEKRSP